MDESSTSQLWSRVYGCSSKGWGWTLQMKTTVTHHDVSPPCTVNCLRGKGSSLQASPQSIQPWLSSVGTNVTVSVHTIFCQSRCECTSVTFRIRRSSDFPSWLEQL